MKLLYVLPIVLFLGLTGCANTKPLDHSISQHGQNHHGKQASELRVEHPSN